MSTVPSPSNGQSDGPSNLYGYTPSRAAPYLFIVLFAISGIAHTFQTYRYKSWRFTFLFTWGATLYVAGFAMREVSTYHTDDLGIFIASIVLHYVAPPVYQAANYFILGRVLHYVPYLSPLHPGRVVSTFIGLDVVVEILSASGASRLARWDIPSEQELGYALFKASLLLQVALFFSFIFLQGLFHRRCVRHGFFSRNLRSIMILMYISNSLILARNIYRVVDSFLGPDGATKKNEAYEYVFDSLPILLNALLLNAFFPAVYLPRSNKVYIASDGSCRKGPGWQDKRKFLVTVLDPFDLAGLVRGKDATTKFWENEQDHAIVSSRKEAASDSNARSMVAKVLDPLHIGGFKASFSRPAEVRDMPEGSA